MNQNQKKTEMSFWDEGTRPSQPLVFDKASKINKPIGFCRSPIDSIEICSVIPKEVKEAFEASTKRP